MRNDGQHAIAIDFVVDLTELAINRASHGDGVARADLPEIKCLLRRSRCTGGLGIRKPQFFQRHQEIPGGHSLFQRHNRVLPDLGLGSSSRCASCGLCLA